MIGWLPLRQARSAAHQASCARRRPAPHCLAGEGVSWLAPHVLKPDLPTVTFDI
jgi:hypothetical protein